MRFLDEVSFGEAQAYVNKWEAWWREDYMKSGQYKFMTFEEYLDLMGITERRNGLKEALNELMKRGDAA